ncbi:hypothetical protein L1887_03909 [Cichorium endivia]|nr:hypothetical protein L1887_03909 [Cichorium endivia]
MTRTQRRLPSTSSLPRRAATVPSLIPTVAHFLSISIQEIERKGATVGMREGTVAARLGSEEFEGRRRWVLVIGTKGVAGEEGCDWKWWSCGLGPCWVSSEWKNTAGKCRRRSPELLIVYRGRSMVMSR